jgi:hypothetical protein
MKFKFAALIIWSFCCGAACAAPALWYQWNSKLNNQRYCAQFSPGDGWKQSDGPYKDARCKIRAATENDTPSPRPSSTPQTMQSSGTAHFPSSTSP